MDFQSRAQSNIDRIRLNVREIAGKLLQNCRFGIFRAYALEDLPCGSFAFVTMQSIIISLALYTLLFSLLTSLKYYSTWCI
jgi:hypothetical protein